MDAVISALIQTVFLRTECFPETLKNEKVALRGDLFYCAERQNPQQVLLHAAAAFDFEHQINNQVARRFRLITPFVHRLLHFTLKHVARFG